VICALTLWNPPAGRTSWLLEVGPGLLEICVLAAVYRTLPLSHWVYVCVFLHVLILIYGGYYTYALTPLGNWAKDAFGLHRNHYDRIGHLALGVFPAFVTREVLLRRTPLVRGAWLTFLVLSVILAIAAFWELIEWWTTLFVALVGAAVALPLLGRAHDASIARVPGR
jgi:putative membrane protein